MSDEWDDYGSGPFCRHWDDPSDCEKVCATCGHRCAIHVFGEGEPWACEEQGCQCTLWKEPA